MASPIFFRQTRFYSESGRAEFGLILAACKWDWEEMYQAVVYPVGDRPDNRAWPAFQRVLTGPTRGTVFGQPDAGHSPRTVASPADFRFVAGRSAVLTDLLRYETRTIRAGGDGGVDLEIAADLRVTRRELG